MDIAPLSGITQKQADSIADNWFNDPDYYSGAEGWVQALWDPAREFRPLFDRLDTSKIVELACGHGRNSWQMRDWGNEITLVDVVPDNIDVCRERFKDRSDVSFVTNTGTEYTGLPDSSYTAIFCYDAMVHFDHLVVFAYLLDSARILTEGGKALFHHSNFAYNPGGDYRTNPSWRNYMPPGLFADYVAKAGLVVEEQKLISWGGVFGIDALTLVRKP